MAITVDTATFTIQSNTTIDITALTIPSNTYRGIAVVISQRGNTSDWVTGVVWDPTGANEALTRRVTGTDANSRAYAYSLSQPTAGSSKTLRVSTANVNAFYFVTVILFHADDTIVYDTSGTGSGTSNTPTLDITPGDQPVLVVGSAISEANSTGTGVGAWADATVNNSDEGSWIAMSGYAIKTSTATVTTDFNTTQSDAWLVVNMTMTAAGLGTPQVNKSENITASESKSLTVSSPQVSQTQQIRVSESRTVRPQIATAQTQQIRITDAPTARPQISPSQTQQIRISESKTLTVSAPQITKTENITISDTPTVAIAPPPDNDVSVTDNITVSESSAAEVSAPEVAQTQDVAVSESVGAEVSSPEINVSESITVQDIPTASIPTAGALEVSASETIVVTDIPHRYTDQIVVMEYVEVYVVSSVLSVNVSENITVADAANAEVSTPEIDLSENITVSDTPTVYLPSMGDLNVNVSDNITVSEFSIVNCKTEGELWEIFENPQVYWFLTEVTSGTGSDITQSSAQADTGTYSARCFTTNSGATAYLYDQDWTSPWSGVSFNDPGVKTWQRFRVYIPSATAGALTGSEYVDIGGFFVSGTGQGWYLRIKENAALYCEGPNPLGGQHEFNLYGTIPTDQWVSVEIGLWSQTITAVQRAFVVFVDGVCYGWFMYGTGSTDYNRVAAGIVNTNSTDDLIVYIDNWRAFSTGQAPTGADNRPTGDSYTFDFTAQSGENLEYHYYAWVNDSTLDSTYGITPATGSRVQGGTNHANMPDLEDGWSEIEMNWAGGATPSWPPTLVLTYFFAPMIGFKKYVEDEVNLEITIKYYSSTDVRLVYESWSGGGATEYDTWLLPQDHVTGNRHPGQGDKIRVMWEETSATDLHVVADYYDASADTWYLGILDDERDLTNVFGENYLDGKHDNVTFTIDSEDFTITYQSFGIGATFTLYIFKTENITVSDSANVEIGALNVSVSETITVQEATTQTVSTAEIDVSDGITVNESTNLVVGVLADRDASTSDNITVSESILVETEPLDVNVSETITVQETVVQTVSTAEINVSDNITVSEVISVETADLQVDVTENITVSEPGPDVSFAADVDVTDNITVSDAPTVFVDADHRDVSVSENITVSESRDITVLISGVLYATAQDNITVAENVSLTIGDPQVSVQDDITVSEQVDATVSDPQVDQVQDIVVSESVNVSVGTQAFLEVSVQENITVSESTTESVAIFATTSDGITVSESVNLFVGALPTISVSASESITISESTTETVANPFQALSQNITVQENVSVAVSAPQVVVTDNVTITDAPGVFVNPVADLNIGVADGIEVSEFVTVVLPDDLAMSVSDTITVSDLVNVSQGGFLGEDIFKAMRKRIFKAMR